MGRIYPEHSTIAWCEHCQTNTIHDTSSDPSTCQVCGIKLIASAHIDETEE